MDGGVGLAPKGRIETATDAGVLPRERSRCYDYAFVEGVGTAILRA